MEWVVVSQKKKFKVCSQDGEPKGRKNSVLED